MPVNIASGSIELGVLYEVGGTGSVTYNAVSVSTGSRFRGVQSVTTYSTSGSPTVFEVAEIKAVSVSLNPLTNATPEISTIRGVSTSILIASSFSDATNINAVSLSLVTPSYFVSPLRRRANAHTPPTPVLYDLSAFMIGQSNMTGVGDSSAPAMGSYARDYRSATNTWVAAGLGTGETRGSFIPGYGLQNAFCNRYNTLTGKEIDLIKYSKPGSSIAEWIETLTPEAIGYLSPNIAQFSKKRILVYYQGEAEAGSITTSGKEAHKRSLQNVITLWRNVFGSDMPVFFIKPGYLTATVSDSGTDIIAECMNEVAETTPYVYIGFDARPYNGATYKNEDGVHFNQTGLNLVGTGLADAVYNVLSKL